MAPRAQDAAFAKMFGKKAVAAALAKAKKQLEAAHADHDDAATQAAEKKAAGFATVKCKVGQGLEADAAACAAVRKHLLSAIFS